MTKLHRDRFALQSIQNRSDSYKICILNYFIQIFLPKAVAFKSYQIISELNGKFQRHGFIVH